MPTVDVSDDTYHRVEAFASLVESVIEAEIDVAACVELILRRGMDRMLADLIGQEPAVLLGSFQQLAALHPDEVYAYVTSMMEEGALVKEREALRRRIGFRPPDPPASGR